MKRVARFLTIIALSAAIPTIATAAQYGDFTYYANDFAVTITGYTGPGGDITIPDTIAGLPVALIGDRAFYQCTALTSVTNGNNVIAIGFEAFYFCTALTGVTLPASVTSIGDWAFAYCTVLANVYFCATPPTPGSYVFPNTPATLYYLTPFASSWPAGFADCPTALWNPTFTDCAMIAGEFSGTVTGTDDIPVAFEAGPHPRMGPWQRLATTTLTAGQRIFTDPDAANHPTRFYRIIGP